MPTPWPSTSSKATRKDLQLAALHHQGRQQAQDILARFGGEDAPRAQPGHDRGRGAAELDPEHQPTPRTSRI
jgi:hypothetical protein